MAKRYKLVTTLSDGTEINAGTFEVPDASGGTQLYSHILQMLLYQNSTLYVVLCEVISSRSTAYDQDAFLSLIQERTSVILYITPATTLNMTFAYAYGNGTLSGLTIQPATGDAISGWTSLSIDDSIAEL